MGSGEMAQPSSKAQTVLLETWVQFLAHIPGSSQSPITQTPEDLTPLASAGTCTHGHIPTQRHTHLF